MQDATSTIACAFGPRGVPAVLKPVEVMGIEQARKWGVCTLNEFRQFMGLRKFESFEEWCGVTDVAVCLSPFPRPFELACMHLPSFAGEMLIPRYRKPPEGFMATSITSSCTSVCRLNRPSRPASVRVCALGIPSPALSSPMLSASLGAIGS